MPGTRQELQQLPPLPKRLLRAKCGTPKPPPGPPPSFLVLARQLTPSGTRNRSRTPTRDVQLTSQELESLSEDPQRAHAPIWNRPASLGATCKPGCYMLAALRIAPKMSSSIIGSHRLEPNDGDR